MKKGIHVLLALALLLVGATAVLVSARPAAEAAGEETGRKGQPPAAQAGPADEIEGEDEEEAPTVEIPLEKQQLIGVRTVAAARLPLQRTIRTVGRIEYDERRLATVNTKYGGWIEKLHADYVGKYVKKGEPLAEIYSPELFATQQEFLSSLKWSERREARGGDSEVARMLVRDAESVTEAARERLRLWNITEEQIAAIEQSGKAERTMTIYSPENGYVTAKPEVQGGRVMPGEKLFDIADLSRVWIIADVYEYELPLIEVGRKAAITLSYFPGKVYTATVDYVYPMLSGSTRTAKVRFSLPNPGNRLKPQMFTNVEVKIDMGKRLAVPADAVIDTGVRQIVYVDQGEGFFEPRVITTGLHADGMVEVLAGLAEQEKVATAATFLIDSEAKLKGIVQ